MSHLVVTPEMELPIDQPVNLLPGHIREDLDIFDDQLVTVREITTVLKIGPTKWWEGVKRGIYPKPIYLGARCTRWSKRAIDNLMRTGVQQANA